MFNALKWKHRSRFREPHHCFDYKWILWIGKKLTQSCPLNSYWLLYNSSLPEKMLLTSKCIIIWPLSFIFMDLVTLRKRYQVGFYKACSEQQIYWRNWMRFGNIIAQILVYKGEYSTLPGWRKQFFFYFICWGRNRNNRSFMWSKQKHKTELDLCPHI